MGQLRERRTRPYNHIGVRGRGGKKKIAPEVPPHEGQDIAQGRHLFMIPSRLLEGKVSLWSQRMPKQDRATRL